MARNLYAESAGDGVWRAEDGLLISHPLPSTIHRSETQFPAQLRLHHISLRGLLAANVLDDCYLSIDGGETLRPPSGFYGSLEALCAAIDPSQSLLALSTESGGEHRLTPKSDCQFSPALASLLHCPPTTHAAGRPIPVLYEPLRALTECLFMITSPQLKRNYSICGHEHSVVGFVSLAPGFGAQFSVENFISSEDACILPSIDVLSRIDLHLTPVTKQCLADFKIDRIDCAVLMSMD